MAHSSCSAMHSQMLLPVPNQKTSHLGILKREKTEVVAGEREKLEAGLRLICASVEGLDAHPGDAPYLRHYATGGLHWTFLGWKIYHIANVWKVNVSRCLLPWPEQSFRFE